MILEIKTQYFTLGNAAYKLFSIIGRSSLETPLGERLFFYFPQLSKNVVCEFVFFIINQFVLKYFVIF